MRTSVLCACLLPWLLNGVAAQTPAITYELVNGSELWQRCWPCEEGRTIELNGTFLLKNIRQTVFDFGGGIDDVDFFGSYQNEDYKITGTGGYGMQVWIFAEGILPTDSLGLSLDINDIQGVRFSAELGFAGDFPTVRHGSFGASDEFSFTLGLVARPISEDFVLFFRRGDVNEDALLDLSDVVALLRHLFLGDRVSCLDSVDSNDDGVLGLSDVIFLLQHLFLGGARPLLPSLYCGLDLTEDSLNCNGQAACMDGG